MTNDYQNNQNTAYGQTYNQGYQAPQQNDAETFDWDGVITQDPDEYVLLVPGEYDFTVTALERAWYDGSENLPACNRAIITCKIETPQGEAHIKNSLFLTKKTEGLLSEFFGCIGQKKKGQPLRMNWGTVVGSRGRCKVTHRSYQGETYNDIKRFLLPADYSQPAAQPVAPTQAANNPQQPQQGWPGARY